MGLVDFLFKNEKQRQVKKLSAIADKIEALEPKFAEMGDADLQRQTELFRSRLKDGEKLDALLPEAFAVCREAAKRVLDMRHFHVQLIGGIVLHQGRIAEMQTGEGKTLVATLPAYLNALTGQGVHIVTVNDYLAKRDAEWMGKVYKFLGLTVGVVTPGMNRAERKAAYAADITYATNNEVGFDYLRDNMAKDLNDVVQRGQVFAIVDEVDSILIDEARTPLIISGPAGESGELYVKADKFVKSLNEDDYIKKEKENQIFLSEDGITKAERYFAINSLGDTENAELTARINSALRANYLMSRDHDYIVENNEIVIVDEFTGRKMAGRRYSEGLHQAIEAKEGVRVRRENRTIATITFQNYFRLYKKLSGMTGTAVTEEAEFKGIYELDVVPIPPNKQVIRNDYADKVFKTKAEKLQAIVDDVVETHKTGQPILVGTTNVEASEELSRMLDKRGIRANVLNAKQHQREAEIVAQAGRFGAVTVATNMAGRGTDILLGGNPEYMARNELQREGMDEGLIAIATAYNTLLDPEEIAARQKYRELLEKYRLVTDAEKEKVRAVGGLKVIGSERHESRRIDNQLRGRSGRQGDPGASCFYLSFEDPLLRLFGGDRLKSFLAEGLVLQSSILTKQIEAAQKRCEENNYAIRKHVLNYDDVMNQQRKLIYTERNEVLNGKDVHEQVIKYFEPVADEITDMYMTDDEGEMKVDVDAFNAELERKLLKEGTGLITEKMLSELPKHEISSLVYDTAVEQYEAKVAHAEELGINFRKLEREILLSTVDRHWMAHISNMDILRRGIGLRGYGQRDPFIEYRREGFEMFDAMIDTIQEATAVLLARIDPDQLLEVVKAQQQRRERAMERSRYSAPKTAEKKPGRNDPCPCGSGKKYKNCCGK